MRLIDKREEFLQFAGSGDTNPGSITIYRGRLNKFYQWAAECQLHTITFEEVADWTDDMLNNQKLSVAFAVACRKTLNRYCKWMLSRNLIDDNPVEFAKLQRLKVPRPDKQVFTTDHYRRLLAVTRKERRPYWYPAILLAWNTGLRISDVAMMKWESIDFDTEALSLVPFKTRRMKPKKIEIPIEPDLYDVLLELKENPKYPGNPHVLPDMNGYYIYSRVRLNEQFTKICKLADVQDRSFHCFRHTFITRMLESGVDSLIVMAITGLSLKQVQEYAHISLAAKRAAMLKSRIQNLVAA